MTERPTPSEALESKSKLHAASFIREQLAQAKTETKGFAKANKEAGITLWWANLENTLTELCPAEKETVGLMLRTHIRKARADAWNESLSQSLIRSIPYPGLILARKGMLVEEDPSLRTYDEIITTRRAIGAHIHKLIKKGREGLDILNEPRKSKLAELMHKMQHGISTIEDHIDYQLTLGDPLLQQSLTKDDPFIFLTDSFKEGSLPLRIAERVPRESTQERERREIEFQKLSNNLYAIRKYTTSLGKAEGFAYVLKEDNIITQFLRTNSTSNLE